MDRKIQILDESVKSYTAKEAMKQVIDTINSRTVQAVKVITLEEDGSLEEQLLFAKMFIRFLHKNHRSVFLLTKSEKQLLEIVERLSNEQSGVQIVGGIALEEERVAEDMILNRINGVETDCVLAVLPPEEQETFLASCRMGLDAKIWLNLGTNTKIHQKKKKIGPIRQFFFRHK